jgi:hypothetical protein
MSNAVVTGLEFETYVMDSQVSALFTFGQICGDLQSKLQLFLTNSTTGLAFSERTTSLPPPGRLAFVSCELLNLLSRGF